VTGATGFIGSNLTKELVKREKVKCLARETSNKDKVDELRYHGADIVYGDIRDKQSLERAVEGVDSVVHLVGIMLGTRKEKATYEQIHVEGTRNLVDICKEKGVRKFIYVSALGAGSNAVTPFLRTKYEAEEITKSVPYVIFRPSFVHGKGDYLVSQITNNIERYHVTFVPIPNAKSQPIYVEDLNKCLIKSLYDDRTTNKTYEIGGPDQLTFDEFVDSIINVSGVRARKIHVGRRMANLTGIWPISKAYEKFFSSLPPTLEQLTMLQTDNTCDVEAVKKDFEIDLTPFKEALKSYL
ncbi:MAG: complex I NDUFA9 subunit family protein, partial [Candidatus Aenigmarchaeota archaeon]|nr:complex I NDUFA9 subunit family protein [Candidatus Aenigmarchaeota archaeon]